MKILYLIAFLIMTSCQSRTDNPTNENMTDDPTFDAELATKLGADEYGMSNYVIAFLKRGPNRDQDSLTSANLQRAHLDNMSVMAKAGKLVLAGPFMDDGDLRGIYVFAVESLKEAEELTNSDPAVQAGSLILELHPWYGSAAVKQIPDIHKIISKKEI